MFSDARSGHRRKQLDHVGEQRLRLRASRVASPWFRCSHGTATEQEQSLEAAVAIPKKGSRLITVDGTVFRWRVRHKPTYCQGMAWAPLSFAAERAEEPGAVLVVSLPRARPDNWLAER